MKGGVYMNTKNPMIIGAIVVVVAVASFFGGMKYDQSKKTTSAFANRMGGNAPQNGQFTGRATGTSGATGMRGNGNNMTNGSIVSADSSSITVKMQNGSSKIVLLTSGVTIKKAVDGTQSDLQVGTNVNVFGTSNTDGSITAQNIQISTQNPMATPPAK